MKTITAQEFLKRVKSSPTFVLDVRDPDEFAFKHVFDSHNIPLKDLQNNQHKIPSNENVYVICQSGVRSREACQSLNAFGFKTLISVEGGVQAVENAGGSLVQSSKTLPMMRQVQVVAGLLVVVGVVFAHFLHPGWIAISLFVGMGLIFAGVTGFCGMAKVLGLMPWNRPDRSNKNQ